MAISLIARSYAFNVNGADTSCNSSGSPIDTTGATLFVIAICGNGLGGLSITDTGSNSWTALSPSPASLFAGSSILYYCENPVTNASHSFTLNYNAGVRLAGCMMAFGSVGAYDIHENDNDIGSSSTVTPGSSGVPSEDGCLFVTMTAWGDLSADAVTASIGSSFNLITGQIADGGGGSHYGIATAWFEQGTAGALNPTWTFSSSQPGSSANIAVFQPGSQPVYVGVIGSFDVMY